MLRSSSWRVLSQVLWVVFLMTGMSSSASQQSKTWLRMRSWRWWTGRGRGCLDQPRDAVVDQPATRGGDRHRRSSKQPHIQQITVIVDIGSHQHTRRGPTHLLGPVTINGAQSVGPSGHDEVHTGQALRKQLGDCLIGSSTRSASSMRIT